METTTLLPKQLCQNCSQDILVVIPFIRLCRESAKKWSQLSNFFDEYTVPNKTKNLYINLRDQDILSFTDTKKCPVKPARNYTQALKNFKNRLNRVRAYQKKNIQNRKVLFKRELKCPDCDTPFSSATKLMEHVRDMGLKLCIHCMMVFKLEEMGQHLTTEHGIVSFACKICDDVYEDKYLLQRHMKKYHKKGSAFCVECKRSFRKQEGLRSHTYLHSATLCQGCNKKFSSNTCYKKHNCVNPINAHPKFICDYCGKEYQFKGALKRHIETKHLNRHWDHQCHLCGKRFLSLSVLLEHDNTHNRVEDRYVCDICGSKYSTRRGYERHKNRHASDGKLRPLRKPLRVECRIERI